MGGLVAIGTIMSMITLTPFFIVLFTIVFMASIGKSFGVRRLYVNLLVKIFEFGRQNIEIVRQQQYANITRSEPEEDELPATDSTDAGKPDVEDGSSGKANGILPNGNTRHKLSNGGGDAPKIVNGGNSVISRAESLILSPEVIDDTRSKSTELGESGNQHQHQHEDGEEGDREGDAESDGSGEHEGTGFKLSNCLDYVKSGMEAIIEDDVTSRFLAEELKNWNLLTRTNRHYEFISWRLTVIWMIGFLIRYFVLMPMRVLICFIGVVYCVIGFAIVGMIPIFQLRRMVNDIVFKHTFRMITRSISGVVRFHNPQYKPKNCGFCVANHTTPIDIAILSTDCTYSLIGQRHGGFLGVLQRALARASPHIWFERAEAKDRMFVAKRLKEHVSDPINPPILIFPEGTCINNTSVMQFKKGSFEVGGVIYPVAIKYDPRFGDAFWNSSRYSMMQYLFLMMTSWAIVCDVWYLPPMYREEGESAIDFANRVKSVIAKQGGLVDLVWDGQLKRMKPKKEWKEKQQERFSKLLKGE
ncbi:glycerol-3-phosphate acyltransferase 3 isoform X2 [Anopheles aquasalis]|uniref:glycerol-3-phosphate acyltransferase 3 isoform X2 n=1 Tax=Anopheles aquasalis TaxID=42839 RepID=UPI00215AB38D|nr:glycerol-3-phosphate acyltransferase 3 isoform X2 [Anopheles aquasalis]